MPKSDAQLRREVVAELYWDPTVDQCDVEVTVLEGTVILAGQLRSYAMRCAAVAAARRVAAHAVHDNLTVELPVETRRSDDELAHSVKSMLSWHVTLPDSGIDVCVRGGWIHLSGAVDWQCQKELAEDAIRCVRGVCGITNEIEIRKLVAVDDVRRRIEWALERQVELDAGRIHVDASGGTVTLRGTVRSWLERQHAERAAWCAPGVTDVRDELLISC